MCMDFEYMRTINPNYTIEMYKGNEPERVEQGVDGLFEYYTDRDSSNNGTIATYCGEVQSGSWIFGDISVTFFDYRVFEGNHFLFQIMFNSGHDDSYWLYESQDGEVKLHSKGKKPYLSEAKLRKILNPSKAKAPTSKAYQMFIAKARELFELGDWKGEYRDI